jgi:hypothetical protein
MTHTTEAGATPAAPALRDPMGLFRWLAGFLIAYVIASVAVIALAVPFHLLSQGDPNYTPADTPSVAIALGFVGASLINVGVSLLCMVLAGRLTFRLMRNLHQFGSPFVTISPGWAVGYHFIPFANLVMPVKAVAEIWRGTFDAIGQSERTPNGLIGWWWACWLVGNGCDNIGSRLAGDSWFQEPAPIAQEALYAALGFWSVGSLLDVIGAILMIRLFGALARGQKHLISTEAF